MPRSVTINSELINKAKSTLATFKRPSAWVLAFGWSLAACAGLVNSVAFGALGHFVSHATGATTSIALGLEGYHHDEVGLEHAGDAGGLLLSFLLGAFMCGLLIDKNQVSFGGKSLYGVALIGNALLLIAAVELHVQFEDSWDAACLCAMACGLQNAMCTSHFGAVIRTTHVTGTITDIGSSAGRITMVYLRKGCRRSKLNALERADVCVDARRLIVLVPMWLSFFLGGILGAVLEHYWHVFALLVPATLTFSVGVAYMLFRQQLKAQLKKLNQRRLQKQCDELESGWTRAKHCVDEMRHRGDFAHGSNDQVDFEEMVGTMRRVEEHLEELYHRAASAVQGPLSSRQEQYRVP